MNTKHIMGTTGSLTAFVLMLTSCAATQTALEHSRLQVSTHQSNTIFLEPVPKTQKTVYLSIKNTSDEEVNITDSLTQALRDKGYTRVSNPLQAHYLLQANVLRVGKMSVAASQSALGGGYGSAVAGAVAGTALGSLSHTGSGMIAGGVAGGLVGLAADSLVKAVNYTMITDVLISERVGKGVRVKEQFKANLANGSASTTVQSYSKSSQYQKYRTRIVSNADKVNLKFPEARSALEHGLTKAISGIF
ncbi:TPA: complement resistance protein TraT [Legionella pneumophila]